jgi:hypothetical protein
MFISARCSQENADLKDSSMEPTIIHVSTDGDELGGLHSLIITDRLEEKRRIDGFTILGL